MAGEAKLQAEIIKFLKSKGCIVFKQNASAYSVKGTPDIFWFFEGMYGAIEVKDHKNSKHQPGQDMFIKKFEDWSYGRFISHETWPEEKAYLEEILR